MTFPALQGRSDPRVLCGILANQVLKELNTERQDKIDDAAVTICLVNLLGILDMYRHQVMDTIPEPAGILQREPDETSDWMTLEEEDPLKDLERAMESAQAQVFGANITRDDAAKRVGDVLRKRLSGHTSESGEFAQTKLFFEALLQSLKQSR